jgi:hypothetical protein
MAPHTPPNRRDFLKAGAAAGLGLALAPAAEARRGQAPPLAGKAKSCIFLMLTGGPSQLDTWDPKPDAPSEVRGPFRPIATRVPGVQVSELFPKMAALADKFALVRSLHHTAAPIHENGFQLLNTGRLFRDGPAWPNIGAVVAYLRRSEPQDVPWVLMPFEDINTGVDVDSGLSPGHLSLLDVTCNLVEVHLPAMYAVIEQPEPYGGSVFGASCYLASRFTGDRVSHFATVNMYRTVFDSISWDCHADGGSLATTLGDYRDTVAPTFDSAFTALLADLEGRGLLDTTLVVAVGEFGRTPKLNANGGRDHWPGCWTAILAGGGVQGGRVVGSSDATGSEPADRPVTCPELVATIYHALGIPADTRIPGPGGSPVPVVEARPVLELF